MLSEAGRRFAELSTPAKLLLILSAVILPIGLGLVLIANEGIRDANALLRSQAQEESRLSARGIESLIARNAMALRVAANGRIGTGPDPCLRVQRSLSVTPAVARHFELLTPGGETICEVGNVPDAGPLPLVAPGDIALTILPNENGLTLRVGVSGGMATGTLSQAELRTAALDAVPDVHGLTIRDRQHELVLIAPDPLRRDKREYSTSVLPIASGRLNVLRWSQPACRWSPPATGSCSCCLS